LNFSCLLYNKHLINRAGGLYGRNLRPVVYRPHCVRSLLTTSVKILPYRPPAWLITAKCHKAGRMVTGDVEGFLAPRNERRECLILVNISMFCNCWKHLCTQSFWILLHQRLVRLAQTITTRYSNKTLWCLFPRKKLLLFYLQSLWYEIPLLLYCTKLGNFFLPWNKRTLFFRLEESQDLIEQEFQALIDYLSQK